MSHILRKYGFDDRVIHHDNINEKLNLTTPTYEFSDSVILQDRKCAIEFIKRNLDLNN